LFDVEFITRLVELMVDKDLREIDLRDGESKICLKRGVSGEMFQSVVPAPVTIPGVPSVPPGTPGGAHAATPTEAESEEGLVPISSPMVGTFYTAPDPESPPFVTIGSSVGPDTVVCIIEAMKVFNEIKAEVTGTIERILVQNEQPVEFGQPLFLIRPA
jgi:acetyl-CoA carboxylase biotin carboxyl carrier protein